MDRCDVTCVHQEVVDRVGRQLPSVAEVQPLAEQFRLLADPSRLRLLLALRRDELCVCDLAAVTENSVSAISHQLRLLRTAGLVQSRREGKMIFYRLTDAQWPGFLEAELKALGQ